LPRGAAGEKITGWASNIRSRAAMDLARLGARWRRAEPPVAAAVGAGFRIKVPFLATVRLRPSILALFVILTVPVIAAIVVANYLSNEAIARANAERLVERFRAETIDDIRNAFDPIRSLVRSVAIVGTGQPGFYNDNRSLKYLLSALRHSDTIISVYVGLNDGSFRQARRINPAIAVQKQLPPKDTSYADRWIDPAKPPAASADHYVFLDKAEKEIGRSEAPTSYDPRLRPWYRMAVQNNALVVTDPEPFAVLNLIGFTIAGPFYDKGAVAGVAAADITLDGLSRYLAAHKVSPGTLSYILDSGGGVLANSELLRTYSNENGKVELQHLSSLANVMPAIAYISRPHHGDGLFTFSRNGEDYIGSLSQLPLQFGKRWQLFIITPLHDFTGPFDKNNTRLLMFGVTAIALDILIIYLLSKVISAPLEKLAVKVRKIQNLAKHDMPPVQSRIQEVAVLSNAIETLDTTITSFSAYVPVGLVNQLLNSDQKFKLGGHSRFLTIFFSDLEAFSTLSEEIPSQDLMVRVSAYLELVTRAVNAEAGTIDKFIGDGVMAFWGAPNLLDDHAWHACLAALRIARGMQALNQRWAEEGLGPFNLRIGIHSDAVIVGNIGSTERMSYTVIGDGVNIASRLEGINKEYGTRLCISHSVFREAGERLCVRPIDDVVVKGRRTKIAIYELLGAFGAGPQFEPAPTALRLSKLSRLAYTALVQEDFALALTRYQEILKEFPDDRVTAELVRKLGTAGPVQSVE
jgi:adenylate cyclase